MKAQHRIFIATLYVGKEERELAMFLTKALARRPQLQLTILMDAMRATRESPQSTSSASLLSHLASMFPDQVDLRSQLVASQLVGLGMARWVVRLDAVRAADAQTLAAAVGPTIQRYLTEDLD